MKLTPSSHVVLGLLSGMGRATSYDLKQAAEQLEFWTPQHAQLYSEPTKLAEAGLLREEREEGGRRRRFYEITAAGRRAFEAWLDEASEETYQLRDAGLMRLFFGADPARLAPAQLAVHERKLAEYEALLSEFTPDSAQGMRLAVEAGIGHEREYVRFWKSLVRGSGA
jgi:DNA-binding PadR family transcriptional regulator